MSKIPKISHINKKKTFLTLFKFGQNVPLVRHCGGGGISGLITKNICESYYKIMYQHNGNDEDDDNDLDHENGFGSPLCVKGLSWEAPS